MYFSLCLLHTHTHPRTHTRAPMQLRYCSLVAKLHQGAKQAVFIWPYCAWCNFLWFLCSPLLHNESRLSQTWCKHPARQANQLRWRKKQILETSGENWPKSRVNAHKLIWSQTRAGQTTYDETSFTSIYLFNEAKVACYVIYCIWVAKTDIHIHSLKRRHNHILLTLTLN